MSSPSHPAPPSDAFSPLTARLAEMRTAPPQPDPVRAWMATHREELRPHAGKRVAIDPVRGLLAVGADYGEVADALDRMGIDPEAGHAIVPVFG